MANNTHVIVLFGACNSGKSSIINAVARTSECLISKDGKPKTSEPQYVKYENKIYIDTPGLPKSPSKMLQLPFSPQVSPSFIWLVMNSQAAIEDDEFKILSVNPDIPAIIILNKVDILKNEVDVENFDQFEYPTKNRKLAAVHERLMNKKKCNQNIRHICIMSLKDENNDERPAIGIDFLQKMTDLELNNPNKDVVQSKSINVQSG